MEQREEISFRSRAARSSDDSFIEERLNAMFRRPKLGRRDHEWTKWVSRLPGNTKNEHVSGSEEKIAIEIIEGWSSPRIALAVAATLLLSLAATLLWIFLGVESTSFVSPGPPDYAGQPWQLTDSTGSNVLTGVALGMLVLLFGWTGVGAWVLLSWLAS